MKHHFSILLVYALYVFFTASSCNAPSQSNDGYGHEQGTESHTHDHDHDHEHDAGELSFLLFSNDYELFVEFPVLIVGQTSTFTAHFTQLSKYKPVAEGKLTVSISNDNNSIRHIVEAPSSPGIFHPALQPKEAGIFTLVFELVSPSGDARFELADIRVFANAKEAAHVNEEREAEDEIAYLKEQAWKTEFTTQNVTLQPFYSVIHTSARVKGQPQSSLALSAQTEGQVNLIAVLGQSVRKGELVAVITSSGIENNLNTKLIESQIAFEKSKADYYRTKPLVEIQLVTQKDYLHIESLYKQDSMRYYQLANQVSQKGLRVTAPIEGFISSINVSNGEFVDRSSVIMHLGSRSQLLIEAYVNQSDFQKVSGIFDANFSFADYKETITLGEINGKVNSNTAFVNENTTRIPVTFSVQNNGKLMPGMFLEAFLKTGRKEQALVVPLSAIIEEQGQYFVFVQTGGESYVKRQVELANNDGILTEITSGLSEGERIVAKGAFQIKLASMAGELPFHGHTH